MKTIKRIAGKILLLILVFLCLQIAVSAANESATEISFQLGEGEEYTEGDYRYVIVTDKKTANNLLRSLNISEQIGMFRFPLNWVEYL